MNIYKSLACCIAVLAFLLFSFINSSAQTTSNFNDGYITIFRQTSSTTLGSTGTAIFIDEYHPTNTSQTNSNFTVTIPSSGATGMVAGATTSSNGSISRSENGRYILVPGFSTATGGASLGAANTTNILCAVRPIDGSGTINTGITGAANWFTNANDFRGVTSDDLSNYWLTGNTLGVLTTTNGTTVTPLIATTTSSSFLNTRVVSIINGQLYYSTGSTTPSAGIYQIGTGKPIVGNQSAVNINNPVPYGFSISPDGLTMYAVNTNNIVRYTYSGTYNTSNGLYAGGSWSTASTGFALTGATGLAVDWSNYTFSASTSSNGAIIYASNPTNLVRGVDNGTGAISTTTLATLTGFNTFKQIAFSPIKQTVSLGLNAPTTSSIAPATNNANLFEFTLSANEGNATVRKVIVHQNGTMVLGSDLTNIRLVFDANNNGILESSEITANAYSGVVNGNDVSFSTPTFTYINQGSSVNFFLIGDIASAATGTFIPVIQSNKTLNGNNYTTNIVNAGASWVSIGTNPPLGNTITILLPSTISVTSALTPFTACAGVNSIPQSFSVSGSNLSSNITITAPAGFEVSTALNSGYASSLVLTSISGSVSSTPIFCRTTVAASGTLSGSISCTATNVTTQTIAVNATINTVPIISGTTTICNGATSQLSSTLPAALSNAWNSSNLSIASISNSGLVTANAVGTAQITFTANNGCQNTTNIVVSAMPTAPVLGAISPICVGTILNLTATSVSGASYSWTGPNGFSSTLQNPSISNATTAAGGLYSVSATIGACTSTPSTVTATVNPITPSPILPSVAPICAGATLNLTASTIAGAIYAWTGPNGFTSTLQNPSIPNASISASGTYSVTATSGSCPSSPVTVSATVNAIPSAPTLSYNSPICVGSNLNLTASAVTGATYTWTGPNGFIATLQNPVISNVTTAASGIYNASVAVNGCSSILANTSVVVNSPITFSISAGGPTSFTNGGSVTLSAALVTGATYQWYNGLLPVAGAITNSYIATVGGNYTLKITLNGCVSSSNVITVTVLGLPTASIAAGGPTTFCAGSSVLLTAYAVTGYTFQWYLNGNIIPSATNATYTATVSGNYSAVVTSSSNVSATSNVISVTVTPFANNMLTTSGPTTFCNGDSVKINAVNAPGNTYQWKNGTTVIAGATSTSFTANQQGAYTVDISNASCTITSNPISVTVNTTPTLTSSISPISICSGSTVQYNANASVPSSTISWTRSAVAGISNAASNGLSTINEVLQNTTALSVTATYQFTIAANGCSSTVNLPVIVNAIPILTSSKTINPICSGTSFNYTPTVNTTNTSITWQRNAIGGILNASASGSSSINEILTLSGTSLTTATYAIIMNTVNGCSGSDFIGVNVKPNPSFTSTTQMGSACSGITFTFAPSTNIVGSTINWARASLAGISNAAASGTGSINETLINTTSNPITVTYSLNANASGCSTNNYTATFIVNPTPLQPQIAANGIVTGQINICNGESLTLSSNASGVATYNWFSNGTKIAQSNSVVVNNAGIYKLFVTNSFACSSPFSNEIEVRVPCDIGIYMPTVFTPNNDNDNDIAQPSLPGISRISIFKIINRWGNTVFETNDFYKGWDGTFNGEAQPQDEYFWLIEATTNLNTTLRKEGKLILIR